MSSLLRPGGVFFGVAPDADIILHTLGGSDEVTMQPPEVPFVLRLKRLRDAAKAGGGGERTRGNEGDAKGAGGGSCTNTACAGDGRERLSEFGNGLFFSLENTVTEDADRQGDAHEFLTTRGTLVRLAAAHGLRPIIVESMLRPIGGGGRGGWLPILSAAEARVARLYFSFAFRKEGSSGEGGEPKVEVEERDQDGV